MNGRDEYNVKYLNKINKILSEQPAYLSGYTNSLTDTTVSTKYTYLNNVIGFINFINKDVSDLNFDDFISYIAKTEYKPNGENTSSSYRIAIYSALKRFSNYLFISGKINNDYMLSIKRPSNFESSKTVEKRSKGYLTEKEIDTYLRTVQTNVIHEFRQVGDAWNKRDTVIIKLFLFTGIRCSALNNINIDDIDFYNRTLIVMDKGNKVKKYDLPDELISEIEEWINIRSKLLLTNDKQCLFISNRRCRMNQTSINNIIKKYSGEIKGKNITPHKLRATYGTQLYNKTKDLYFVQDCMGHSNPKTTELYIRDKKENMKKASDIMSKIIK